ncbi:NAD(P)-binding domain [Phaffia rhodozyma]|uniref:NAD(P)-binding domain n=1 Tax=Phaffia rhodozyma TaxID=264483 RepID=A0A0F7SEX8_PHARH|nr:NAD(P)-binding domain [Phaffia rhodozyma]
MLHVNKSDPTLVSTDRPQIFDRNSPPNPTNARGQAETEFLNLSIDGHETVVLNLAGLFGGERLVRNWIARVADDKEALRKKGGVHLIHGDDVSHCIVRLVQDLDLLPKPDSSSARRFIICDTRVYDWWDLASSLPLDPEAESRRWVRELMREESEPVLPRPTGRLGRVLDARDFWEIWGISPRRRIE